MKFQKCLKCEMITKLIAMETETHDKNFHQPKIETSIIWEHPWEGEPYR